MPNAELKSGDRVVELAGVVLSAATASGFFCGPLVVLLTSGSWPMAALALLLAAVLGMGIGKILGNSYYRKGGNTRVIKVGPDSLAATIPAGIAGSLTSSLLVTILAYFLFSTSLVTALLTLGTGLVIGIIMACLGSLL